MRLVQRRENQILFAHAVRWVDDHPIAPEVCTILYEDLVPAWHQDDRDVEAIANAILASPGLDSVETADEQFDRYDRLVARIWPPAPGMRPRSWGGGPVPSSHFRGG